MVTRGLTLADASRFSTIGELIDFFTEYNSINYPEDGAHHKHRDPNVKVVEKATEADWLKLIYS